MIVPAQGSKVKDFLMKISGTGFLKGGEVRLKQATRADIMPADTDVIDDTRIICTFDLTTATAGKWDVVVINPNGGQGQLNQAFEVQG